MENDQAVFILAREQRRAAIEEAERATAEREADEAAEAAIKAEQWRREYQDLLSRRPGLRAEIATVDLELTKAIATLQAAHAAASALLARRTAAEQQATRLNARLSRLAGWIGDGRRWSDDVLPVPDAGINWRIMAWIARPWPGE